jgi:hypothetical protein
LTINHDVADATQRDRSSPTAAGRIRDAQGDIIGRGFAERAVVEFATECHDLWRSRKYRCRRRRNSANAHDCENARGGTQAGTMPANRID